MTVMNDSERVDVGEPEARRLRRELFSDELIDQLLASAGDRGVWMVRTAVRAQCPGYSGDAGSVRPARLRRWPCWRSYSMKVCVSY